MKFLNFQKLTRKEEKALEGVDWSSYGSTGQQVENNIVNMMKDSKKLPEYTDCSMSEIKSLCILRGVSLYTRDRIKEQFYHDYIALKKSNNRKSLDRAEEMVIASVQQRRKGVGGWLERNILGKEST